MTYGFTDLQWSQILDRRLCLARQVCDNSVHAVCAALVEDTHFTKMRSRYTLTHLEIHAYTLKIHAYTLEIHALHI
jgi:hypothetical protein